MPAAVAIPLVTAAVGAGTTAYGAHAAGKSSRRASDVQAKADADTLAIERERDAEAKRQFDAQEAQKAKEFAASEEERAYARQQADYDRQLQRDKEARLAPYRQASAAALGSLGKILGIDLSGRQASVMTPPPPPMSGQAGPMPTGAPTSGPMTVPRGGMTGYSGSPDWQNLSAPQAVPTVADLIQWQQASKGMRA